MRKFFLCLLGFFLLAAKPAYAAYQPPFHPGEFRIWEREYFPCNLDKENALDLQMFEDMQKTKRRYVEMEQRDIVFGERKMTCDSFVHAGVLYVPVRQTAEFLGEEALYFPDEKIIMLKYRDRAAQEPQQAAVEKKLPEMKEIEMNNIPIYFQCREAPMDEHKEKDNIYYAFNTFQCEGTLFMPMRTLADAHGLARRYQGNEVFLYAESDFPRMEAVRVGVSFILTGVDRNAELDISDETIKKILVKAAGRVSEPGKVTYLATQKLLYHGRPAVLLVIGGTSGYPYMPFPVETYYDAYVYVLEE